MVRVRGECSSKARWFRVRVMARVRVRVRVGVGVKVGERLEARGCGCRGGSAQAKPG